MVLDDDGTPLHTIGQTQDITELKQTQEKLRKREQFHRRAISGANDGLWEINLKTMEMYRSQRWVAMLGYEVGEILNTREALFEIVHPDDLEILKETQRSHIENNTPIDYVLPLRHKKGHWVHVRSRGQMTPDKNCEPWYLSGSNMDITDQIVAKKALQASGVPVFDGDGTFSGYRGTNLEITSEVEAAKASEEPEKKFRALFEMAGDAIMVSNPSNFKFIEVNKLAAEQRGYGVDELAGMNIRDINKVFDAELAQGL